MCIGNANLRYQVTAMPRCLGSTPVQPPRLSHQHSVQKPDPDPQTTNILPVFALAHRLILWHMVVTHTRLLGPRGALNVSLEPISVAEPRLQAFLLYSALKLCPPPHPIAPLPLPLHCHEPHNHGHLAFCWGNITGF